MNGNILRHTTAAFRLIPYIQRDELNRLAQEPVLESDASADDGNRQDDRTHPSGRHSTESSQDESEKDGYSE